MTTPYNFNNVLASVLKQGEKDAVYKYTVKLLKESDNSIRIVSEAIEKENLTSSIEFFNKPEEEVKAPEIITDLTPGT